MPLEIGYRMEHVELGTACRETEKVGVILQTGMSPKDRETLKEELLLFVKRHDGDGLLSVSFGEAERAVREGSVEFSDDR